jgi:PAS domain S-box-containing protein
MNILCLDDREDGRYFLETLLKGNGHEVECASNGEAALAKLPLRQFDLIISDILMPIMDGFQFCRRVKSDERLRNIPFLFFTATYTGPQDEEFALKIGANRFLRKPCEPDQLMTVITEVMTEAGKNTSHTPSAPPLPEEEVLRLYSERLVRKLEQKMLDAEAGAKALLTEKEKFQTLIDELPLGMVLIGSDQAFHYLNPQFSELSGYVLADLPDVQTWLTQAFPQSSHRREIQEHLRRQQTPIPEFTPFCLTTPLRCCDGSNTQVRIHLSFPTTGDILVIFEDVSEQLRLETKLRQAQKTEAIATLAGGIAHDFNNILGVIQGFAELVNLGTKSSEKTGEMIQGILQATSRARQLVKHILDFSRQSEQARMPLALHLVVQEVLSLLKSTLPATIEIRRDIDPEGSILADPTQMHQMLLNLCTNAFHAMRPTGGVLDIGLKKRHPSPEERSSIPGLAAIPYLVLSVKDTGCGMSADVLTRMFDPYFTTKPEGEGTGLGLSVTHGIVKSHQGIIDVSSVPNKGTTFRVFLPCIEPSAEVPPPVAEPALPTGTERILLIEDEPALLELQVKMLQMLGYQVTGKNSPVESLVFFQRAPRNFDLVITDLTMPQLTGIELAREIQRIRPGLPMLLCSGTGVPPKEGEVSGIGFRGFLKKPFLLKELAGSVRDALDQAPPKKSA